VRRSETGPGKPYWKRPEGSTGATAAAATLGSIVPMAMGEGGRGAALEGTAMVGCVAVLAATTGSCCRRAPKNAAVVAAPTTAEAPATAARVSLLMVAAGVIGEVVRQGLEEAARSAWSIYSSVVSLQQHADVIICSSETGMNFAQPIKEHRGRPLVACVLNSTTFLSYTNDSVH